MAHGECRDSQVFHFGGGNPVVWLQDSGVWNKDLGQIGGCSIFRGKIGDGTIGRRTKNVGSSELDHRLAMPFLRTVPPSQTGTYEVGHDGCKRLLGGFIGGGGHQVRACRIVSLPMRLGGLGMRSLGRISQAS